MRSRLAALAAVLAGVWYGPEPAASADEQQVHGRLTSQAFTEGCASPVGLCTAGRLEGVINGDFVFTAASLQPSATPGVFFYTGGHLRIHGTFTPAEGGNSRYEGLISR